MTNTRPVGPTPRALADADDCIFDLQCLADAQQTNTRELLAFMDRADDDGVIDADEWRYIFRHVRLEHKWNEESWGACTALRGLMSGLADLVGWYRSKLQKQRAALASGSAKRTKAIVAAER